MDPNLLLVLIFVKACHIIFNDHKQFRFPGDMLLPCKFLWSYSIGEMRKCFNCDLRATIFPQCEMKGSNILGTIYVCQWVHALCDFPCICRITTRTLDSVRGGANNGNSVVRCLSEINVKFKSNSFTEFDLNFTFISDRYAVTFHSSISSYMIKW